MVRDNPWIENEDEYSETFSCKLCFGTEKRRKKEYCLMLQLLGLKDLKMFGGNLYCFI